MATPTTLPAAFVAGNVLTAAQMNDLRGAFRIMQVVYGSSSTSTSSSSNVWVDTGLSVSITPSSTSSKVLAFANLNDCSKDTGNTGLSLRLVRTTTTILEFAQDAGFTNTATRNDFGSVSCVYLDSPATTSATTYKVQMRSIQNIAAVYVSRGTTGSLSTMVLCEVSA
jgi:hypothetical protein